MNEPETKHITLETLAVFFWFLVDGFWLMEWRWPTYALSVLSVVVFTAALVYVSGKPVVWFIAFADLAWLLCNVSWAIGDLEKLPEWVSLAKFLFAVGFVCCLGAFVSSGKLDVVLRRLRLLRWLQRPEYFLNTCCPQCHNETLNVRIESSGSGQTEFGNAYWYQGQGKCSHCGWKGQHSDQSI